jgi:hypothetical protein
MTPTPSTAQKKALGKLLLLSYYTTQKKEFRIQIFPGEHPIMGLQMFVKKSALCTHWLHGHRHVHSPT